MIRILSHQLDLRFFNFSVVHIGNGSVQISVMLEMARYYLVKITCFYSWYELVRKSRGCNTSTGVVLWYFVRVRVSTQIRIRHKTFVTPPDDSVLFKNNIYRYLSGSYMGFQDTNHFFFVSMLHVRLTDKWMRIDKFRLLKFLAYLSDWLISNKISLLSKALWHF